MSINHKVKIAFVIYRNWAFEIVKKIKVPKADIFIITTKDREFSLTKAKKHAQVKAIDGNNNEEIFTTLKKFKAGVVFFYGWSWIVKDEILENFLCFCLHPSLLPKYRGGSPIQHQLIRREKKSAVTVFKMSKQIDAGDIYMQLPMSLSGDINDIFKRMTNLGIKITKKFISDYKKGDIKLTPQKQSQRYPSFKRRVQKDSEIKTENLKDMIFEDLNNLVRGLLDPFPNAYFIFDGKKVSILKVKKVKKINSEENVINSKEGLFLRLRDGYAKIVTYKTIEN